ncbi:MULTISPECIES: thioredoxin family protein [Oleiagrimonas]|uniref:Thioredoxin family protein n=1 Tax=Oleiagrimonas citrea TaxID=1665687 RepID=A0A846ZNZ8_9GAMM|nr:MULTISPECIES: thioredoxin family protein [Oleiagrimonas]NKZ39290.1 thioredoxin family protein [Oleiagrimonas citrea]RAP59728.1 thiol reductase thioredoxin [Oleiagrimonas sp. MCCC 1A03011]
MKRLLSLVALAALVATGAMAATAMPYNPKADAKAEVHHALQTAQKNDKPVLVFFGANWCPDCRALAKAIKTGKNATLMHANFNIVKVDVGNFDRNLDIDKRFGDPIKKGIPAAVIVSPQGKVLYATRAGELANARHMSDQGVYDFFEQRLSEIKQAHTSE